MQLAALDGDTADLSWIAFLQKNLKADAPAENGSPIGLYNVDITFHVNKDGTVSDVKVFEDPGYGTGAEVKRLMRNSPVWQPGSCHEKPIVNTEIQRITFAVHDYK